MKNLKHIIAIIIVLAVVAIAVGIVLPRLSGLQGETGEKSENALADSTSTATVTDDPATADSASYEERMQASLETLKAEYNKRKKRNIWTLGRGKTIIVYLMQLQRFVKSNGGQILHMEEIHDDRSSAFQTAQVEILKTEGDTLKLELQVSESIFRDDASMLAVAFQVKNLTPELIVALNKLDYPYDLLVPPFGTEDGFLRDLEKVKNKELALWIPMESSELDKRHNKLRPLRIHHTEEKIEAVIDSAKKVIPNAKGIVTRFGEQAVEHKQLMQAILKPTEKNNLWFVDATRNMLSKVPEVCKSMNIRCKQASPYNPDNSRLSDYMRTKMRECTRNGLSVMIVPLTLSNVEMLTDLSTRAKNQGTTLINLSTFMKY